MLFRAELAWKGERSGSCEISGNCTAVDSDGVCRTRILSTKAVRRYAARLVREGDGPPQQLGLGPMINDVGALGACEWAPS
jgi:hypothetical protein